MAPCQTEGMQEQRRWVNQSQPQTLYIATFLFYMDAVFDVLLNGYLFFIPLGPLLVAGSVAAGYGIANEKKWGYGIGVGVAGFNLAFLLYILGGNFLAGGIALVFAVAKLALLLHPQSREYQKIWFR